MAPLLAPLRAALAAPRSAVRNRLRGWLRIEPGLRLVGEAPNGPAALRLIARTVPDVVILHVNLPRLDGFGVMEALAQSQQAPAVILVAQGPEGAVRAFGARATDYLQIPFDVLRLRRSLDRARQQILDRSLRGPIPNQAGGVNAGRLAVPVDHRTLFIPLDDLLWIKAEGRRSTMHLRDGVRLAELPFGVLSRRLPRETFLQINRSVIVRRDFIREIRPKSHGSRWVVFQNGIACVLTRSRRLSVLRRL